MKQALVGEYVGVRFPALLLIMISRKALLVGFVGLVFAVSGTASVLQSFGTISGTADVEPAVKIVEVDYKAASGAEYVKLYNPSNGEANLSGWRIGDNSGDDSIPGLTIPSNSNALLLDNDANTSNLDINFEKFAAIGHRQLEDGGEVLNISSDSGVKVDEVDFSSDPCGTDQVRTFDWEKDSASCNSPSYDFSGGSQ